MKKNNIIQKRAIFDDIARSKVFLNEDEHVYIHKDTGEVFSSVTGALSLVKGEFDANAIIPRMQKKYQTVLNWYRKREGSDEHLPYLMHLYSNYEKARTPIGESVWQGKVTPKFKAITKYETVTELLNELEQVAKEKPSTKIKATYLNEKYEIMSVDEIQYLWKLVNNFSQVYGHLLHEILEDYVLTIQGTHTPQTKINKKQIIQSKYDKLLEMLSNTNFGHNKEYFSPYFMDMNCKDFKQYIIEEYNKSVPISDLGLVCIPEKVIYSPKFSICGMSDQVVVQSISDNNKYNIKIPDHKSNKEFTTYSEYGKMLKEPFSELEDCSATNYMLQINTYGYILQEEYGMKFNGGWISYFNRVNKQFEIYQIEEKLHLAEKLLNLFDETNKLRVERFRLGGWLDKIPKIYHSYIAQKMSEDVNRRKSNEDIDYTDANANRKYYVKFAQGIVKKLATIKE